MRQGATSGIHHHAQSVGGLGVTPQFCPMLTTVGAGKPSAELFSWLPPRQLASSGRVLALLQHNEK